MAMEVTQILLNALSTDASARELAQKNLKQFEEQNAAAFLVSMAYELANPEKPTESRQLAGLNLKNALDAKEATRKAELMQRWIQLDPAAKSQIKAALLATLSAAATEAGHTAAQAIAKVAAIELPRGEWPELVQSLLANMGSALGAVAQQGGPEAVANVKRSTLEALGYVCEEIAGTEVLGQEQVNAILTAVVQGMNQQETNNSVRLAATRALYNALEFAHTNFENDMERNYIMTVVCEATLCPDSRVRQAAFECLVSIASNYYEKLSPYMQDIFVITSKATREDEEGVSLQAVELWSTICDAEIEIQEEFSGDSEVTNFHFIKQALPALVPMLLETLLKQEDDQDFDENKWCLSMAGGTCLGSVARTVGDDIVPLVMPFVQENIAKPDWRAREAATYAFGSILEGPSLEKLTPLVNMALTFLLNAMKDDNVHVKDTTAWTLCRIFEILHGPDLESPIITSANLPVILNVLLESIKDAPHVADKVCGALYNLAQGYEGFEGSSPLSPFFQGIVQALLITADREDATESKLRASAYETLNEMIRSSSDDAAPLVLQLIPVIMQKLSATLSVQIDNRDDREKQLQLLALLCSVLHVAINKLGNNDATKVGIVQFADQMMDLFLGVFASRGAKSAIEADKGDGEDKSAEPTVHEEAMLAIGSLAQVLGPDFVKYMQFLYPFLEMGLQNFKAYSVCSVTVGVVGDICRALEEKVAPFCDGIMPLLLKDLSSTQLHRSVKPPIFSCFGDIALAIGDQFEKYLQNAMVMLQSAAELSAQQAAVRDEEMVEYNNQLRTGIFEAYAGIFQGLKGGTKSDMLVPYAEHILLFIETVYQDKERDETVTKGAIGVLGDLADTLVATKSGAQQYGLQLFSSHPFFREFVEECQQSEDVSVKELAEWAQNRISAFSVAGSS